MAGVREVYGNSGVMGLARGISLRSDVSNELVGKLVEISPI